MTEFELDTINGAAPQQRSFHPEWIFPLLFRPRRTLEKIVREEKGVWLTPLVLLTLAAVILVLAQGPIRKTEAQMNTSMPESAQYFTPEQQAQLQEGLDAKQGPVFIYVFPAIGILVGLWLNWFLLGSLLHLALTMVGSRSSSITSFNLAAWAGLPLVFRFIVRTVYILSSRQMITSPGLSGFLAADAAGFGVYARILLGLVDAYLLWQVALLLVGVTPASGLSRPKAWVVTLLVVLSLLALLSLPGFLIAKLSGMQTIQPYFFF